MRWLVLVITFGLVLALYGAYVSYKTEQAAKFGTRYVALCDIGIFSCTKIFSSEYGHISQFFGLPRIQNSIFGIGFYTLELLIERRPWPLLLMATFSCIGSLGLFYILTIVLHDFCLVCFSIYVVNFTVFFTALGRVRAGRRGTSKPSRKQ